MLLSVSRGLSFSSESDILDLVTAILFGLLSILVAVAAVPRRRIVYWLEPCARDKENGIRDKVKIGLAGRGRQDIAVEHFQEGSPLLLDIGRTIIGQPEAQTWPKTRPTPKVAVCNGHLAIGPSLIGRNQVMIFTVYTEPGEHKISEMSPLVDVTVERRYWWSKGLLIGSAVTAAVIAGLSRCCWHLLHHHNKTDFVVDAFFWLMVVVSMIWIIKVWMIHECQRREQRKRGVWAAAEARIRGHFRDAPTAIIAADKKEPHGSQVPSPQSAGATVETE